MNVEVTLVLRSIGSQSLEPFREDGISVHKVRVAEGHWEAVVTVGDVY